MLGLRSLVIVSLAGGCRPGTALVVDEPDDPSSGSTGTPGPTTLPSATSAADVTGLGARLHERFGTLIVVSWTQDQTGTARAEFSSDEGVWLSSPPREVGAGEHEEVLVGVPYEATVTWRLVIENAFGTVTSADQQIDTASWPSTLPSAVPTVSEPSGWDPAMPYVLAALTEDGGKIGDRWWVVILDRRARPIWAYQTSDAKMTMHPRVSLDGRSLLLDENAYWGTFGSGGADSTIRRMLLDGTTLETWDAPGLHHPFTELPDGTIAYGSMSFPYQNEWLVEIAPDRSIRTVFDCEAWLVEQGLDDYCGSNTLTYRESTDSYLYSFYSLDSILDIARSTGVPTRTFGEIPGAYAFDPPDAGMWWQHGGYWTEQGTLMSSTYAVFGHPGAAPRDEETVVREWEVDDANETLRLVWDFGVGDGVYGPQMGEAHRLPNGNVLHNLGTLARLREGLPDGTVVWDVAWPEHEIGRSVPVADPYALLPERR